MGCGVWLTVLLLDCMNDPAIRGNTVLRCSENAKYVSRGRSCCCMDGNDQAGVRETAVLKHSKNFRWLWRHIMVLFERR